MRRMRPGRRRALQSMRCRHWQSLAGISSLAGPVADGGPAVWRSDCQLARIFPSPVYSSSPARAGDGITLRSSAACGYCLSAACSEHIFNSVRICRAKTRIYSAKRSLCCDPQGGCEPLNLIGRAPGSDAPVAAVAPETNTARYCESVILRL
jgi:hypothetical protein